mgnify:CR=1 FL=1
MIHETSLTHFSPNAIARYYYALLAMSCMMAMGYAISTVTAAQANLSALAYAEPRRPEPGQTARRGIPRLLAVLRRSCSSP